MKAMRYILPSLLILFIIGLLCYQGFYTKDLDRSALTRALLIIAGAVLSMIRPNRKKAVNKKSLYQKAYSEFIINAFSDNPKLEKKFYNSIHAYNEGKLSTALKSLDKLRKECTNSNDTRAVTIFTALCLDDIGLYDQAIEKYDYARRIRDNSTLASNMGLCYERTGKYEEAEGAFQQALYMDPQNEYAHNNLSGMFFRLGEYEEALLHAENALKCNDKMPQALSTAAVCSALEGNEEKYKQYYRRAVAAGYNGEKIKNAIRNLSTEL